MENVIADVDDITWKPATGNCSVDKVIETWDIPLYELFNGSFNKFVKCVLNLELSIVEMFDTLDNVQVTYTPGDDKFQVVIAYKPVGDDDLFNGEI